MYKAPAKKPKPRASKKVEYPEAFEIIWDAYPKRKGTNSKADAFSKFKQRRSERVMWSNLEAGVHRYAEYCNATGITGTEYVMAAERFFGTGQHYENDWTTPTTSEPLPKNNDELPSWAAGKGYREAYPGESGADYRRALTILHKAKQEQ